MANLGNAGDGAGGQLEYFPMAERKGMSAGAGGHAHTGGVEVGDFVEGQDGSVDVLLARVHHSSPHRHLFLRHLLRRLIGPSAGQARWVE